MLYEVITELFLAEDCDCLVAIGGGSPIDCAKCISIVTVIYVAIPTMYLKAIIPIRSIANPTLKISKESQKMILNLFMIPLPCNGLL